MLFIIPFVLAYYHVGFSCFTLHNHLLINLLNVFKYTLGFTFGICVMYPFWRFDVHSVDGLTYLLGGVVIAVFASPFILLGITLLRGLLH